MELSAGNISLIAIYFLLIFGIGFWVKRRETTDEFLIGGRKIGLLQTAASVFAVVGAVLLVGQAALAYDLGFGALWLWIGLALGLVGLGFAAGKIKTLADQHNFLTLSDYIFTKFDYKTGVLSSIILFAAFFALLTGQFIAGGSLFAPLLDISYSTAVIVLGVGTLVYLLLGGFKAVIKTDLLQFIIMIAIFLVVLLNLDFSGVPQSQFSLATIDSVTILTLLAGGLFTIFAAPDIWQRVFAANSIQTAKKGLFIAAIVFVLFGIVLSTIGIVAQANFPNIDSGEALYYGLFELVPPALLGIVVIAVLAAIMSTIDTELFYLSSSIAKDFFHRRGEKTNEQLAKIIYRSLLVIAIISMLIAIYISDIVLLLFALLSLTYCVAPTVIATFFMNVKNNAAFLSMGTALLVFIGYLVLGRLTPDNAIITLPTAIVFLIVGQSIFGQRSESN